MVVGLDWGRGLGDRPQQGCWGGTNEAEGNAPVGPGTQNLVSALPALTRVKRGHHFPQLPGENQGSGEAGFSLSSVLRRVVWKGKEEERVKFKET